MILALRDTYRRLRYGKSIVVVSGLPRSGTSMMMRMLDAAGMEIMTDRVREADEDNPRGYYEYERVKDLDKEPDKSWLGEARGKVVKIISFLLKEIPGDYHCKVVFMRRHLDEILASQHKMLDRRQEASETRDAKMRENYENHLWRVAYMLKHQPHFDGIDVHYTRALEDPRGEAARVANFLNPALDVEKMAAAVEKQLYRNRKS